MAGPDPRRVATAAAVAAALLVPAIARAQAQAPPLVIDYADVLRRTVQGDTLLYHLEGNVRAHRGDLFMRSQQAVVDRTSGEADFTRNVHFSDPTTELYADHVHYTDATDVAVADGRVQVIDRGSGSNVNADTVRYDRRLGLVTARPRPHAVLMPEDTTGQEEPFDLYADEMRFLSDSTRNQFVAVRKVLIERSDLTAIGDSLFYDRDAGVVALRIGPQVETEETYLTASRIDVEMADRELKALVAVGRAQAVQKGDSIPPWVPPAFDNVAQTSFLDGDSIYISMVDGGIDWLVAEGHARSLNYARESPPGPIETWSVNYLLGNKLTLNFSADTLERVVATGGQRGVYRKEDVRIGGPEHRPSEPIPLPADFGVAGTALAAGRRRRGGRSR